MSYFVYIIDKLKMLFLHIYYVFLKLLLSVCHWKRDFPFFNLKFGIFEILIILFCIFQKED